MSSFSLLTGSVRLLALHYKMTIERKTFWMDLRHQGYHNSTTKDTKWDSRTALESGKNDEVNVLKKQGVCWGGLMAICFLLSKVFKFKHSLYISFSACAYVVIQFSVYDVYCLVAFNLPYKNPQSLWSFHKSISSFNPCFFVTNILILFSFFASYLFGQGIFHCLWPYFQISGKMLFLDFCPLERFLFPESVCTCVYGTRDWN